jgi:hypothetical protein
MAHFAKVNENGAVEQVIVVSNESCGEPALSFPDTEVVGVGFITGTLGLDGTWRQTSYNGNFRGCYAGAGYTYDEENDVFVAPVAQEDSDEA